MAWHWIALILLGVPYLIMGLFTAGLTSPWVKNPLWGLWIVIAWPYYWFIDK